MAERNFPRRRKQYFPRVNPLERFNREEKFRRRYRLSKEKVREIAEDFRTSNFATKGTRSGGGLSHEERVSLAIRFLASGSLYSLLSDSQGLDPSTVCRAVDAFVKYMFTVKGRYIKWPKPREYAQAALKWSEIADFPRVLAAVDGTHIALRCPSREDNIYYCRKNFHSLNVMGACGADMQFHYISAKMPGSCHDSYVWDVSSLGQKAKNQGFGPFYLLGDSGYALRRHMLTPFATPRTPEQHRYNAAHKSTRCVVERAFGVLKQRFRVLDQSSGYIMSSPEKVSLIVVACVCLHNIAIQAGQELDIDDVELGRIIEMDARNAVELVPRPTGLDRNLYLEGVELRNTIVRDYYTEN